MAIDTGTPEPRSRRAILVGAIGGLAAIVGSRFASPDKASAAAGGPVIMGAANSAGVTNTSLATTSTGTALLVTQNGAGTALRGSAVGPGSIAGFFTAQNGTGISGVTGAPGSYGVFASNNGAAGSAGALRASGVNNHGVVATTTSDAHNAVKAVNSAVDGNAIRGQATATGSSFAAGVLGEADGDFGNGVLGIANSLTGSPIAVHGIAENPAATAVLAEVTAGTFDNGIAVRANGGNNHGLIAEAANENAWAVRATHSGTDGTAILGEMTATDGTSTAVRGEIAGPGNAVVGYAPMGKGVLGQSDVETGIGVTGFNLSATGPSQGVFGFVNSSSGTGVRGYADATSGTTYGVYGQTASANGFGIYSDGNAHVTGDLSVIGTLTKGSGTFKIDHPLDPANKFLSHSFVESPDMMNIYNGIATLDGKGEATVTLAAWFGTLNKEFRYQLTAIGTAGPNLHIKSEAKGNKFSIAGGVAGQRVSWQLTGVRQDAYANAHRVVVEEAKPAALKGRYLHPKENGQPASKGIDALHASPAPAMAPLKPTPKLPSTPRR